MVGRLNLKVDEDLLFHRTVWPIERFNLSLIALGVSTGRASYAGPYDELRFCVSADSQRDHAKRDDRR